MSGWLWVTPLALQEGDFQGSALTSVHDLVFLPQISQTPQNLGGIQSRDESRAQGKKALPSVKSVHIPHGL